MISLSHCTKKNSLKPIQNSFFPISLPLNLRRVPKKKDACMMATEAALQDLSALKEEEEKEVVLSAEQKKEIEDTQKSISHLIARLKYARKINGTGRRETWRETVKRAMDMFAERFKDKPLILDLIEKYSPLVYDIKALPAMRVMQFAGDALLKNNCRAYNCSFMHIKTMDCFKTFFYLLMSGCGVGFSVQKRHVNQLPPIERNWTAETLHRVYTIPDTLEGWCLAMNELIMSYTKDATQPVVFDYSEIRPAGAWLNTSGGVAPGPGPLRKALDNVRKILDTIPNGTKMRPIQVHDILCHIADAVISGGVRRSSCISLFDIDDDEMMDCKSDSEMWIYTTDKDGKKTQIAKNPQRMRCNNSVVLIRGQVTEAQYFDVWNRSVAASKTSGSGEPGIFWTNDPDVGTNPCGEASLEDGEFCNLVEVVATNVESFEDFVERCSACAFFATLQSTFTDFDPEFLPPRWKTQTEKDRLIGVGITGITDNKLVSDKKFDLKKAAQVVLEMNEAIAAELGIPPAARCTVIKPSGTASMLAGASNGIHATHSKFYIRRVRLNINDPYVELFHRYAPTLIEPEQVKPETDCVISLPMASPNATVTRKTETEESFIERQQHFQENWIIPGHRSGANTNAVSATNSVRPHMWDWVGRKLWDTRDRYVSITNLAYDSNFYPQMPFQECTQEVYWKMVDDYKKIRWDDVNESGDFCFDDPLLISSCDGGICELSAARADRLQETNPQETIIA